MREAEVGEEEENREGRREREEGGEEERTEWRKLQRVEEDGEEKGREGGHWEDEGRMKIIGKGGHEELRKWKTAKYERIEEQGWKRRSGR